MRKRTWVLGLVMAVVSILLFTPLGAKAASLVTSAGIADQTIQSRDIAAEGVGASEVRNGSLTGGDMNPNTVKRFLAGERAQVENDGQDEKISSLEDRVEVEEAEGDTGAVLGAHLGSAGTVIENLGGKFAERATLLDTKTIPAGTYLVNTYAFFDRVDNSQPSSPVLQVAVRGVDGSQWGQDLGTVFTGEFPETGNLEQSASGSRVVTLAADTEVKVYGFGYNADTSANGSGNYTVSADVNFVPVG